MLGQAEESINGKVHERTPKVTQEALEAALEVTAEDLASPLDQLSLDVALQVNYMYLPQVPVPARFWVRKRARGTTAAPLPNSKAEICASRTAIIVFGGQL